LPKTRSIPCWTTSDLSSAVTDLVLIYESVISSASVDHWLILHSWTHNYWTLSSHKNDECQMTTHLHKNSRIESSLMSRPTVRRPACLGIKHPYGTYDQTFTTIRQLLVCWFGALFSDETMDLPLTIAAGPRQRIHSRIWVPWDSRPYITVSYSRLPFLSPPTTRRVRVRVRVRVTLQLAVYRQSVLLGAQPLETHGQNFFLIWTPAVLVLIQRPLWREDVSVIYNCCLPSPGHSF
jgi:hypothetical protein